MKNVLADRRLTQRGGGDGTHRPHMYPTPGQAWGMGVVGGCTRAVPVRPPFPLTPFQHNQMWDFKANKNKVYLSSKNGGKRG